MRILYVQPAVSPSKGGAQWNTAHLALGMAQRGHKIGLVGGFSSLPTLIPQLRQANISVVDHHIHERGAQSLPGLMWHIRKFNPDVIHSYLRSADIVASIASIPFRAMSVSTVGEHLPTYHDVANPSPYKSKLHRWSLSKRMSAVVATSAFVKNSLLKYAEIGNHRIHTIPNGIDTQVFCPSRRENPSSLFGIPLDGKLVIGVIGRISIEKRPSMLLDIVSRMNAKGLDVVGLFIGDGSQRSEMEELVERNRQNNVIKFVGIRDDMDRVYRALDLVVHFCDVEGFGLTHAEALASGTPIVAAKGGAASELIIDGENGYLVDINDSESFARQSHALLTNSNLRRQFRISGLKIIKDYFSLDRYVTNNENLYEMISGACREH